MEYRSNICLLAVDGMHALSLLITMHADMHMAIQARTCMPYPCMICTECCTVQTQTMQSFLGQRARLTSDSRRVLQLLMPNNPLRLRAGGGSGGRRAEEAVDRGAKAEPLELRLPLLPLLL